MLITLRFNTHHNEVLSETIPAGTDNIKNPNCDPKKSMHINMIATPEFSFPSHW